MAPKQFKKPAVFDLTAPEVPEAPTTLAATMAPATITKSSSTGPSPQTPTSTSTSQTIATGRSQSDSQRAVSGSITPTHSSRTASGQFTPPASRPSATTHAFEPSTRAIISPTPVQPPSSLKRKPTTPLPPLPPPPQRRTNSLETTPYLSASDSDDEPVSRLRQIEKFPLIDGSDMIDALYRNDQIPHDEDPIRSLINNIPLESDDEDAPVGVRRRRKLVKKSEYDPDTGYGIKNFDLTGEDEGEEKVSEEDIEADRKKIERAAKELGCRKMVVKVNRREEVEENGAEVNVPKTNTGRGILGVLDDPMSDEEDLVARPPGFRVDNAQVVPERRNSEDSMEIIQGEDLGKVDHRKYKDIEEEVIRWRVPGMKTPLLDHQCLGVKWMIEHEMQLRLPHGGLVADVMGLGKTMQAIAVMLLNPPLPRTLENPSPPKVTLIVCPVALLQQWKEEIEAHCKNGAFRVFIHHGANKIKNLADLKNQDVVLCSYSTIMMSCPPVKPPKHEQIPAEDYQAWFEDEYAKKKGIWHKMTYWRVILDESHVIRNRRSRTSVACQKLSSEITWCLTGTPIQNTVDDIFPVFSFLKHPQCGQLSAWQGITGDTSEDVKCRRVQAILRGCFMRRLKTDILAGEPLITLPKKRVRMVELEFGEEERALYMVIEGKTRARINEFIRKGVAANSYSQILTMLLRLRQICDHPYLIIQQISDEFDADDIDQALAIINNETPSDKENQPPVATVAKPSTSTLARLLHAARHRPTGSAEICHTCRSTISGPVMGRCRHPHCRDCVSDLLLAANLNSGTAHCNTCGLALHEADIRDIHIPGAEDESTDSTDWLVPLQPFTHSTKTLALKAQIDEWTQNHPGEKIIIFSQFVKMLDIAEIILEELNIPNVRYQGSMSLFEREESLKELRKNPYTRIMLTSIKAGGVGLNLTTANLVISLDLWWNAATELQAFDRVHRLGQEKEVFVTRMMVKNTVEERILNLQEDKLKVAKAAMGEQGGAGKLGGKLTMNELLGLFGNMVRGETGRMEVREDYALGDLMRRAREVDRRRREA